MNREPPRLIFGFATADGSHAFLVEIEAYHGIERASRRAETLAEEFRIRHDLPEGAMLPMDERRLAAEIAARGTLP